MKRKSVSCLIAMALVHPQLLPAFTTGNPVVLQLDSSVATGNTGSLVEFDRATANQVSPISSVALPSNGATDNGTSIVFGSSSVLNHDISLSADGALIVIPGYANTATAVDTAAASTCPRVVATVKYN